MKITIGTKDYTEIESLKFDPTADITGSSVEVNQFSASIKTSDTIEFGAYARLYDDGGQLWANYWVTESEEVSEGFRDIVAQSLILLLDRFKLPAKIYSGDAASTVIAEIFSNAPKAIYTLDPSFNDVTITGFCPEQTGRERLQWVCFVIGAYIKTFFAEEIQILPVDETIHTLQRNEVFYRPSISYDDFVTAIRVRAYSYVQGTPASTDEYVTEDDKTYYIQSYQDFTTKNENAPETASENVVEITDCTLVNSTNVSGIISRLSGRYFVAPADNGAPARPTQAQFDAIDTGKYLPAMYLSVPINSAGSKAAQGYVSSCSFSFGHTQKAQITLLKIDIADLLEVTIVYTGPDKNGAEHELDRQVYYFPAGVTEEVENPYPDKTFGDVRYIYCPTNEMATVKVGNAEMTITESEFIALQQEKYSELWGTEKDQLIFTSVDKDGMKLDDDGYTVTTKDSTGTETETKMGSLDFS